MILGRGFKYDRLKMIGGFGGGGADSPGDTVVGSVGYDSKTGAGYEGAVTAEDVESGWESDESTGFSSAKDSMGNSTANIMEAAKGNLKAAKVSKQLAPQIFSTFNPLAGLLAQVALKNAPAYGITDAISSVAGYHNRSQTAAGYDKASEAVGGLGGENRIFGDITTPQMANIKANQPTTTEPTSNVTSTTGTGTATTQSVQKKRKKVGLLSMRHTDPFGILELPDIFRPGAA